MTARVADPIASQKADEQARVILESITEAFLGVDRDWRFSYVNPQAEKVLDRMPGDMLGKVIWDVFPGLAGTEFEKAYRGVAAGGVSASLTAFYPDYGRWYEVHAYPAPDGGLSIYFRDVSERKQAEEALRESNALLRGISDSTGDVIYAKDGHGRMRFANPATLALVGKPLDQVLGRTDAEFLDDKAAAGAVMENDRRIMQAGIAEDVEEVVPLPDGTRRVWLSRKMPHRDSGGNVVGLLGVSRDVTRFKDASERVHRLYEVAAALSEAVSPSDVARVTVRQGIAAVGGTAGSLVLLNPEGTHLELADTTGYPAEVMAKWNRFPLDAPIPLAEAVRLNEPVFTESSEDRLRRYPVLADLNGSRQTRSSACLPLIIGGRTVGSLGLGFDRAGAFSTEEKQFMVSLGRQCAQALERARLFEVERLARGQAEAAEREIREIAQKFERQSRLFERIASATPDFIYVLDLTGRFVYANRRLLEVWGTTFENAAGKSMIELGYPQWHAEMHLRELRQVIETKKPVMGEVPFTGGSGISGVYEYIFTPVLDPDGNVEVIAGTTRDITDRKNAEAEREKMIASEREARAEAERASRMKDEFLATLSHELRTPLSAILGWASILAMGKATPAELHEGLETIRRNARAQTQIIEDLLDMSRIINGKLRLDVQRVDLAGVVKSAVDTIRPGADAKGVLLRVVMDPAAGPVSGDPGRLQQVFWNLLTNAVKFTPRGGQVLVALSPVNSHLQVNISDTGEGITTEFLPFVFDRFRQADGSTTRRHGGLGLGLSIVKQLVELHGGTVRVESPGQGLGSTFTVELPRMVIHADTAVTTDPLHPDAVLGEPPAQGDSPELAGLKVIVVDDEADARALIQRLLADCGAVVHTAGNADDALRLIGEHRPDVLVSDIGMPGQDGYALIRRVRALPPGGGRNLPAMALTAYARTEDRVKAVRAGFQAHVAKPVEPVELLAVVASLAGRKE